jgi:hypothetical protein
LSPFAESPTPKRSAKGALQAILEDLIQNIVAVSALILG